VGDALARSGLAPGEIAFVNAHGTGTPDNDRVEGRVLADLLPGVPFLSTKGFTGHTLGAAGAIEAAFTAAMLADRRIPAGAGFSTLDPGIGVAPVSAITPVAGNAALSDSLAFGGSNAAIVLARGEA
jgi:3-oxoacyl-[acyl-carrier-protein] synthase-1/3-oxoacyl-[acyl-carrier-protein] synthase II